MFAEMMRSILDEIPDVVLIADITTLRIDFANRAAQKLTGLSLEQLQTRQLADLISEQQPGNTAEQINRVAAGKMTAIEFDAALHGTQYPIPPQFAWKLSRLVLDHTPYLLCIGRDISMRSALERESATLYSALVTGLSDLMFRITKDGIYRDFHVPESTGLRSPQPEHIIERKVEEIMPDDVTQIAMPAIKKTVETGQVQTVEYAIQEEDKVHYYEARFVPSLPGEIIAVVRDITEKKKETETLERSERLIRALLNASKDAAILLDPGWRIQAINEEAAQRLGNTVENMIGTDIGDYFSYEVWKRRQTYGAEMLRTRQPIEFEDTRDEHIVANRVTPLFDQNGGITHVAIFSQDVTRQRADEQLLERKSALLKGVAEATQRLLVPGDHDAAITDAIAIVGQAAQVDRVYVFENHTAPQTNDHLLSQRYLWTSTDIPENCQKPTYIDRTWVQNGLGRWYNTLSNGGIISGLVQELPDREREILENAGGQLSLLAVPIFVDRVFWGFISFDDCHTPRKWTPDEINTLQTMAANLGTAISRQQTEIELRRERDFADTLRKVGNILSLTREPHSLLEELLEQIQLVIPYDTASAMLLEGNNARVVATKGLERYGFTKDNPPQTLFPVPKTPYMQLMIQHHQPYVSPSVHNDPAWATLPQVHWIQSWLGAPIVYDDVVRGFFSLDSTQENFYSEEHIPLIHSFALQAAIALKNAEYVNDIKTLEQIKTEIIRIASHDLRNPVSRIREFATQLHTELMPQLTAKQNEALQYTLAATHDMSHIIDNILSLDRIEAQHRNAQPIFWNELLHQAVESVRDELQRHAHDLTLNLAPELPVSRGNPFKLERAIHNLIHNAVKYTPAGGKITLRAYVKPYGAKTTVAVEVEDNGIGIPPELHAQLFQPFYRAQQPGTENIPGTGLGLSMVKSVIEEHNGSIYFDSVPGQGSLFGFWVPVIGSA